MDKEINTIFGKRVRERRLALGLTQKELADRAALQRSYIREVETGRRNVTSETAERIAKALEADLIQRLK